MGSQNADFISDENNATYVFKTELRVERFYPSYWDSPRPEPSGLPSTVSYGGAPFDISLPGSSLTDASLEHDVSVMLMRTGFSTQCVPSAPSSR